MGTRHILSRLAILVVLFLLAAPCMRAESTAGPKLADLQKELSARCCFLAESGLATFSAVVTSGQMSSIAKSIGLKEPRLHLVFSGPEQFRVTPEEITGETQQATVMRECAQGIGQSLEGFWQWYVLMVYQNPFLNDTWGATVSMTGSDSAFLVHIDDSIPHQRLSYEIAPDFKLRVMESRDVKTGLRSIFRPEWQQSQGRWLLTSLEVTFFKDGELEPHFLCRARIEHRAVAGLMLPSHVIMQARDGYEAQAKTSFFEYQFSAFELGLEKP